MIQLLAQGPFTQQQTIGLELEGEESRDSWLAAVCPNGSQLGSAAALSRVCLCGDGNDFKATRICIENMSVVTSRPFSWIRKLTAAALGAGENANAVSQLLQQGPYARFQLDVKHVPLQTIEQYGQWYGGRKCRRFSRCSWGKLSGRLTFRRG